MRFWVLVPLLAVGCGSPRRDDPPPDEAEDASALPSPDGVPVQLDPADQLVDVVPVDADGDGDRDLFALIRSVSPPLRVALLEREGDEYGRPRRIDGGILDDVPAGALEIGSARLEPADEDFVRLSFRYKESCALAEIEEAEVEILWPARSPGRPAFSAFRRYRRVGCPGADRAYLEACHPATDRVRSADVEILGDGDRIALTVASAAPGDEPVRFELVWQGERFEQPGTVVSEALEAARAAAADVRAAPADTAIRKAKEALARLEVLCPVIGDLSCHASALGVAEEALARCDASTERGALHLVLALALARQGKGRAALGALARAREVGADAAATARAEREVGRLVAPTPARVVGIVSEAGIPDSDRGARTAPFVWENETSVVYTRADGELGRIVVGEGDRGKLKGLEAREARRGRPGDPRAPNGEHAVVAEDAYGVFVCPTEEEPRRACLQAVRAARADEDDEGVCTIVEDRLPNPAAVRLTIGPCEGATEPVALGFVDDDRVAIVARDAADPVIVSVSDPSRRSPMPGGGSPLYAGSSFSPNGSFRIVVTDLGLFKIDRQTGRETRILPPGWGPERVTVSPDGRQFIAFVATGGARVFALP